MLLVWVGQAGLDKEEELNDDGWEGIGDVALASAHRRYGWLVIARGRLRCVSHGLRAVVAWPLFCVCCFFTPLTVGLVRPSGGWLYNSFFRLAVAEIFVYEL